MIEAFRLSGMMAGILMTVAGFTGFFGPSLRKRIKGDPLSSLCTVGAVLALWHAD